MESEHNKKELKAIRGSIRHWQLDVVEPLKTDRIKLESQEVFQALVWKSSEMLVKISAKDCALCALHASDCGKCSLKAATGKSCWEGRSHYGVFYNKPVMANAKKMVEALVKTYWAVAIIKGA